MVRLCLNCTKSKYLIIEHADMVAISPFVCGGEVMTVDYENRLNKMASGEKQRFFEQTSSISQLIVHGRAL